ncbi:MAG: SGNH/GDSL hydrolase family protein [Oscillospiraceae bacterium]|nr:SGNH/GDSL hydrolase family protein [Oscillospiraceae bacterium]
MKHILCYGDSNTYGLSPEWVHGQFGRHDYSVRWPGRLQALLGPEYRVIEEGLSGRTTVFEDFVTPGRNGADYLRPCLESHAPLDLVIIMLGTNDCRNQFGVSPGEIAMGLGRLIQIVKDPTVYMGMPVPKVLVAVPVPVGEAALKLPDGITTMESIEKSRALAERYRRTADMYGCAYIDLGQVASTTDFEGIHLDAAAHAAVAEAMAAKIREIL